MAQIDGQRGRRERAEKVLELVANGKTDRAALPEPEEAASAQAYEPPATAW